MKSWIDRSTLNAAARAQMLATPDTDPNLPPSVVTWLAQLTLLAGVPVEYLVPDPRLLPSESLRFFYVDRNWLYRAVDGAMSIGTYSSQDTLFNETFFASVYTAVDQAQTLIRSGLPPNVTPDTATADPVSGPLSGILLRSVVVSTWPGMEVSGYAGATLLPLLRMDRLSGNVLLAIFNGVADSVLLQVPPEGFHMGVTPVDPIVEVELRGLGYNNYSVGLPILAGATPILARAPYRTGSPAGVLDIAGPNGLMAAIKTAMPAGALGSSDALTPAGFAIQLIQAAGAQKLSVETPIAGGSQ